MELKVTRVQVWAAGIDDKPGGLAAKLETLADAGADLEFVIARRAPDKPGKGVVFITPIVGDEQQKAAKVAGFVTTESLHSVRVSGPDAQGLGAQIARALASAGINLRGLSAASLGGEFVAHLALDSDADAAKAAKVLKGI